MSSKINDDREDMKASIKEIMDKYREAITSSREELENMQIMPIDVPPYPEPMLPLNIGELPDDSLTETEVKLQAWMEYVDDLRQAQSKIVSMLGEQLDTIKALIFTNTKGSRDERLEYVKLDRRYVNQNAKYLQAKEVFNGIKTRLDKLSKKKSTLDSEIKLRISRRRQWKGY